MKEKILEHIRLMKEQHHTVTVVFVQDDVGKRVQVRGHNILILDAVPMWDNYWKPILEEKKPSKFKYGLGEFWVVAL